MQAIILAAGMGRRLGELTNDNTKCMVKVNGRPLIDRMLRQLQRFELKRIVIVIGYKGKKLKNHIENIHCETPIVFVENDIYDKTNNIYSLALAQNYLSEDDTILLESDLIFEDSMLDHLLSSPLKNLALVAKYESWMDGTVVRLNADNKIVSFIPKSGFHYEDKDSYYKTVNIYKLSAEFSNRHYIPYLNAYMKSQGDNEYYEQVLRVITFLDQADFYALPIEGAKWYEIDDIQDLNIAETLFSPNTECLTKYYKRFGGYWRFPHVLDFCYLVNPYFPTRRLLDELQSNFITLLTEYPSGSQVNTMLASKNFGVNAAYMLVGNGAAELIRPLMNTLTGNLGVIYPTFEEYPNRYREANIVPFLPSKEGFAYTAEDIMSFFEHKSIATLLLVNPDNPSGNLLDSDDLASMLAWSKKQNIRLIVDESFLDFAEGKICSLLDNDILLSNPHLTVIKSISKSYGVPGLRLGIMATGDNDLLKAVKDDLPIWNINSFAEYFMQIYSKHEKDYHKACQTFKAERVRFYNQLKTIPYLEVYPSQSNYFLCKIAAKLSSRELTTQLLSRFQILIKDCSTKKGFNGSSYVRIAIRSTEDNNRLVDALRKI